MKRILVIEDNQSCASFVKTILERELFDVVTVSGAEEGIAALEAASFNLIVTDLGLPHLGGMNLLEKLRATALDTPILVLSGSYVPLMLEELQEAGATDALPKPFNFVEFVQKVRALLQAWRKPSKALRAA